ncbi:MAG: hypothetical protein NT136_01840 [Candidatus Moranbacteria bacterium]|nr:hypothetical protein [Candidatus Moranbacteria bacterium]
MLAKEIIDKLLRIASKKNLINIKSVSLEVGSIALAHNGLSKHVEDTTIENLEFGLRNIAKNTILENTKFSISKIPGEHWKIKDIVVE